VGRQRVRLVSCVDYHQLLESKGFQSTATEIPETLRSAGGYMKDPVRDPVVMPRMQMAFDLYETAEAIMRQNLRRRRPEADETEIERGLAAWLRHRPGERCRRPPVPEVRRPQVTRLLAALRQATASKPERPCRDVTLPVAK
jgi:hypothetical protein